MAERVRLTLVSATLSAKSEERVREASNGHASVVPSCTRIHGVCCAGGKRLSPTIGLRVVRHYSLRVSVILMLRSIFDLCALNVTTVRQRGFSLAVGQRNAHRASASVDGYAGW